MTERPEPPSPDLLIEACGLTDVGLVREHNEDALLFGDLAKPEPWAGQARFSTRAEARGPLFIVCDGLGGAASGEVASHMAAQLIWEEMLASQDTDERLIYARLLRRAVRVANRRIWDRSRRERKHRGMGTTVSVAGFIDNALILAQVGDSRAYILRRGRLVQVTRDQSVVSALVRSGRVTENLAQHLPESNMVLQALGVRRDVEVALSVVDLERDDLLLLCTDGLHNHVPQELLIHILREHTELEVASQKLLAAAGSAGAPDNVSAIIARFSGQRLPAATGDVDLRYLELDPMEEGERSLFDTSVIAHRLAARIGIGEDPAPPVVPATGQFSAMRRDSLRERTRGGADDDQGPAAAAPESAPRVSPFLVAGALLAAVALALWALL